MNLAPESPAPLAGRTILVTGATSGIGERTAHNLSSLGAEVLVNGRRAARVTAVVTAIRAARGAASSFVADLTDRYAVQRMAAEVASGRSVLHALVNNAGAIFTERQETAASAERTFALNVEAPYMLTELLLPLLVRSGRGRVVHVASSAHRAGRMRFDDLDLHDGFSAWKAYGQSKLAIVLLTRQEARVHRALPVTFNCCHPGFVRSRFGDEGRGAGSWALRLAKSVGAISIERGARVPTYLVTAPDLEGTSGAYFVRAGPRPGSRRSQRAEDAERLWSALQARTGVAPFAGTVTPPAP